MKEPLVSILISTYGQVDYTKRCLHSLEATIPKEIQSEILVIDDCSDDETPEFLKKLDPKIRTFYNQERKGRHQQQSFGFKGQRKVSLFFEQ